MPFCKIRARECTSGPVGTQSTHCANQRTQPGWIHSGETCEARSARQELDCWGREPPQNLRPAALQPPRCNRISARHPASPPPLDHFFTRAGKRIHFTSWQEGREGGSLHEREGDDVSDRRAVGQQHHQPVHADPLPSGGWHAVLERGDEVVVDHNLRAHREVRLHA